jgi:hypothetical protein
MTCDAIDYVGPIGGRFESRPLRDFGNDVDDSGTLPAGI